MAPFGEDEIDGLVGEVEEIEAPIAAAPVEEGAWMGLPPGDDGVAFADESAAYGSSVPIEDLLAENAPVAVDAPAAPPARQQAPQSGAGFEIDRGFDPEWPQPVGRHEHQSPEPAPASSTSSPDDLVPIMPFPLPEPDSEWAETESSEVLLTAVASHDDLFSDPSLEVAHLTDGQTREIIVPVMLGEGASARRFKLAIRLRLDEAE